MSTDTQNYGTQYYTSLITSEYQTASKFLAWLTANLQLFQDTLACANTIGNSLDIDQAVGAQLDVLGQIVGAARQVGFQPSNSVSPILDDGTYRILLKATVAFNHWGGLTSGIRSIWEALFPGSVLLINDHQDMTVSVYIGAPLTSILKDLTTHGYILRRPQGVLFTITFATLPIFGFDLNTATIAGFDTGHWA